MIDLDVSAEDEILKHLAEAEGDDCRAPLMHAVVMKLQAKIDGLEEIANRLSELLDD